MEPKATTNPAVREPPVPEKKSKGPSKFFAIFCCCPSSGIDADETVPPAKKTVRPTGPETQPTPEKIDVNTGDSSTVEPKEPNSVGEEKNLAVTSDQSQSTVDERKPVPAMHDSEAAGEIPATIQHEPPREDPSQEKHDETRDSHEPQTMPAATAAVDGGVAPETIVDTQQKSTQDDEPSAVAQVTEPAADTNDHATTATPPSDASMPPQEEEATKLPVNIPPPPPPPIGPEVQIAPHEGPLKLLSPPLPHLQGRKCLVLDLDETLVHSSFKVSARIFGLRKIFS